MSKPGKPKILIANDDETFCYLLKAQLEEYGLDVDAVYDGDFAIEAYKKYKYDLVFLDFYFHSISKNGDKVIVAMQEIDDSIPIIMLTIELGPEIEAECIHLGAREWIYQPYDWIDIERVLKKYLNL